MIHSGYAIDRVDSTEAEAVAAELQRGWNRNGRFRAEVSTPDHCRATRPGSS